MPLLERSEPGDCAALVTGATYIGAIHQVGGDRATGARLTLRRTGDGMFEAHGYLGGGNASICGQNVPLPEGAQEVRLQANSQQTRLSGRVAEAEGTVWYEIEAVPSDVQPCVEVYVEVDPHPFYCGTSAFEGTLCSPVSCRPEHPDGDGDEIPDPFDNCPSRANPTQSDLDLDGVGDSCDADRDGDTCSNDEDEDPNEGRVATGTIETCGAHGPVTLPVSEPASSDPDRDGLPSCRDPDDDDDGLADAEDPCPASHGGTEASCHTESELLKFCSVQIPEGAVQRCSGSGCKEALPSVRRKVVDPVDRKQRQRQRVLIEKMPIQRLNLGVR